MDTKVFESIQKYTKHMEDIYKYGEFIGDCNLIEDKDRLALADCGNYISLDVEGKVVNASFCRKRYCPMCQWRKSERQFSYCLTISKDLYNMGYRFLHMVLTVPNCNGGVELQTTVKHLYSSFNRFYHYKKVKSAFKGVLRCLELSFNYDTHMFHPHLHCLVVVNSSYFNDSRVYISHNALVELWTKACKSDVDLQCSIRAIKEEDTMGFAEVSKYCLKPLELMEDRETDNAYIVNTLGYTLKGVRFTAAFGIMKEELKKVKNSVEDVETQNELEQVFEFVWSHQDHKYIRI